MRADTMRDKGLDPVDAATCKHGFLLVCEDPDIYECPHGCGAEWDGMHCITCGRRTPDGPECAECEAKPPRGMCRHCHQEITLLGGSWTDPDGAICCYLNPASASYAPHQP